MTFEDGFISDVIYSLNQIKSSSSRFFATIMFMKWVFPLVLLIAFESLADILAKQWSLDRKGMLAAGALATYLTANTFWLFALKNGSGLARGAVIFSVASGIVAIFLGIIIYKEELHRVQIVGMILGMLSIALLVWYD